MRTSLKDLARFGAQARIQVIHSEMVAMYEFFPDLFPQGPGVLPGVQQQSQEAVQKQLNGKQAKAQRLIEQAERLHRIHGKPKKTRNKTSPREHRPSDPTGETVLAQEAADLLGISNATIYNNIKKGDIRIFDRKGPQGWQRFLRSDIIAFGVASGRLKPHAAAAMQQLAAPARSAEQPAATEEQPQPPVAEQEHEREHATVGSRRASGKNGKKKTHHKR